MLFRYLLAVMLVGNISSASAGVALGATRVIYPAGEKQVQLAVTSSDEKSTFLIQSWVENENGHKDGQFVMTPPLFTMQGKKENKLRIIDSTSKVLPNDKESLFWISVKAIPSIDKEKLKSNVLQLAIISRIKLFYRPANLSIAPDKAATMLSFHRIDSSLVLKNSSPYYITVTELSVGSRSLKGIMVPPMGTETINLPKDSGNDISYRTINDYGALTPKITVRI
ncbi:fimbria/pilus periplasmic chaperone [Citrobacter sp. Awk 4]|uniref:fimbria/pilus periplasmic chaperone n=1 Tax=Citrobacter sp. Awk 4 TaxID=2963955 RepID=UPI00230403BE|nr:fimbria/pilus periplasmic chaperone [Citrobacter sp. Awk 4]MDA8480761.1 fimbria/pilus periplasmic chaperone [Citrobacter sp. Awk 4]